MNLSEKKWTQLLTELKEHAIPDSEIGNVIVALAKPSEANRISRAKDTILSFLNHPNAWARHEAMWFISWGGLHDSKAAIFRALNDDPDPDNRSYAALCLSQMLRGTNDSEAVVKLRAKLLDESEEKLVRVACYAALLEIAGQRSGTEFVAGMKGFQDIDWDWVRGLTPGNPERTPKNGIIPAPGV
jgi:HEAT repeat protein